MKSNKLTSSRLWGILLFLFLGVIIFIPALSEYYSARKDFLRLWKEQSRIMAETIVRGSENILRFDEKLVSEQRARVRNDGLTIRKLDSLNYPNRQPVIEFARIRFGGRVFFLDKQGNPIDFLATQHKQMPLFRFVRQTIRSLPEDSLVFIIKKTNVPHPMPPAVLIRRSNNRGFILVLYRKGFEQRFVRFQRLRNWMLDIARAPDILFIELQVGPRIIARAGEKFFPPLSARQQATIGHSKWRIVEKNNRTIFDYIQRAPRNTFIRIGIATRALDHLQNSLTQRLILNTFLLLIFGFFALRFILNRQNMWLLENRLRQVETYTGSILQNMNDGILAFNEELTVELSNTVSQGWFGLDPSTTVHLEKLPLPPAVKDKVQRFADFDDLPFDWNDRHLLLNGRVLSIRQTDGTQKRLYLLILHDFTSQRQLEQMRSRRSKLLAMGELASRVAHEIRNPLNGIAMLAQRLQKEFTPKDGHQEFQQMTNAIRQETQRIDQIVQSFLLYAKTPRLKLQTVSVGKFLQDLTPILQALGPNPVNITVNNDCPARIDTDRMKQVLINLVKNAIEASKPEQPITIRVECHSNKTVLIFVEDQGKGIDPQTQERIFDLYFTTKESGSGLGLSIVEKIVEVHDGKIRCESPYLLDGKTITGTRFIIELPQAQEEE